MDNNVEISKRTNLKNYLGIILGIFASQGLGTVFISSFLSFVYTEYLGVSAAIVGVILSIGVVLDGVSDFGMGVIIDRVRTKHGKVRHWFLWMAVPLGLTTALMFTVPTHTPVVFKLIYLFIVYNLYCTAVTAVRLPANTLPAVIGDDKKVRATASFCVAITATVGGMLVNQIVVPAVNAFGGGLAGYRNFNIVLAVLMSVCCLLAYWLITEKQRGTIEAEGKDKAHSGTKLTVRQQLSYLLRNKYWILQQGMTIPFYISAGVSMGVSAYFCEYVIGDMSFFGVMMTAMMAALSVGCLLWLPISRKIDVRTVFIISGFICLAGYLICAASMFLFGHNTSMFIAGIVIFSLGEGGITTLDAVITTRVIDYGEYIHNERQEGLCFSGKSVVNKIVSALCSAGLGFALEASGYVGGMGTIPQGAITVILVLMTIVPSIGYLVCILCSFMFKLSDKRIEEIQKELELRRKAK